MHISRLVTCLFLVATGVAPVSVGGATASAGDRDPAPEDIYPLGCIEARERVLGLEGEYAFDIGRCSDRATVMADLQNFLIGASGYTFEWFFLEPASVDDALALLATDHRESDGTGPYGSEDLARVSAYLDGDAVAAVELGEFATSYISGTGITALVALTSADRRTLVVLSKFRYAE